jgi:hypothetical protein
MAEGEGRAQKAGKSATGEQTPPTRRYEKPGGAVGSSSSGAKAGAAPGTVELASATLRRMTLLDGALLALVVGILVTLWMPGRWASQRRANEEAAVAFAREIVGMQSAYRAKSGGQGGFAPSFFELAKAGVYHGEVPDGGIVVRDGYTFKLAHLGSDGARWYAMGVPVRFGSTGERSVYVDDTGKVRVAAGPVSGPAFPEAP